MNNIKYILLIVFFGSISLHAQTLDDYFKIASENNPELQKKYKDFEMAMKKIPQVSSLPDPNLSIGVFISPVETRVGPQIAKVSLSQMFPWFGTLKANENGTPRRTQTATLLVRLICRNKLGRPLDGRRGGPGRVPVRPGRPHRAEGADNRRHVP